MNAQIQKERTHLFSPSINIAMLATIFGDMTEKVLSAAITKAVLNNEILSCKIALDQDGKAFYEKKEKPLFTIEKFDGDWKTIIQVQETVVFDLENGELIRFFVKGQQDCTQLLMIAHHLVGDGLAVSYLLEDIINALNGHDLTYKPLKLFELNTVPFDSRLSPLMRFMQSSINKKWSKTGKKFSFTEYKDMFTSYWRNRKTEIFCEEINEIQLSALKRIAKQHGITLNSLLTTAFAKVARERSDIGMAASVRPKDYRGMGNYATGISVQYRYNIAKDFWANTKEVHKFIYKKLNNNRAKFFLLEFMNGVSPTLVDAAYFSAFGGYENKVAKTICNMFGYGGKPKSISITNLTTLDIGEQNGDYSIKDIRFVPPLVPNARRLIGISTFRNKMAISFHVENNELLSEEKAFFEDAISYLKQLA